MSLTPWSEHKMNFRLTFMVVLVRVLDAFSLGVDATNDRRQKTADNKADDDKESHHHGDSAGDHFDVFLSTQ